MSFTSERGFKLRAHAMFQIGLLACVVFSFSALGLAQAGQLDPSFANHGIFKTNFANCCGGVSAVALQSDGKILVGGQVTPSRTVGSILRLNTNGTVDTTFGSGGMVTVSLGSIGANIGGLAVQTDGKIVASVSGIFVSRGEFVRFDSNGSIDTTFGTNGFVTISGLFPTGPVLLQPDGKILVAGGEGSSGLLARLDSNGQLDSSFGSGGVGILLTPASGLALLRDGQILVSSGQTGPGPGPGISQFQGVTRYNANGSVDESFAILGQTASVDSPATLMVQTNGSILAAGRSFTGVAPPTLFTGNPTGFSLGRFNANGSVDTSFGSHGGLTTTFPSMNFGEIAAIALQINGDIVAAGQAGFAPSNQSQNTSSFALARYLSSGQLDSTFGTGGRVTLSFGTSNVAFISGMTIQVDGKILVAGSTGDSVGNIAVARYLTQ